MEWISVKDRLPEQGKNVLIITNYGGYDVCRLRIDGDNIWWINSMRPQHSNGGVTHWRELPAPPEVEK